jgi:hypothetical protein
MNTQQNVWHIREELNENYRRVNKLLDNMPADSDPRSQRELFAEIRLNLALANKAAEATLALESARVFELAVIETMEQASPTLRRDFIRRLNEKEQIWRSKYDRRPRPR